MSSLWEGVELLKAIIDTARAEDIHNTPETVRTRYETYAGAYFALESVKRVEQRILDELRQRRSVAGYISADFGYGKTAAAVYLWKRFMDSGVAAVPPFLFRQLKDVMMATKGWLSYELRAHPDLRQKLEDIYGTHASRTVEELAKEIAERKGISETKALDIVREYISTRQDTTTSYMLLDFLRQATELACQANFKGLVVVADESQEFLRTEDRAREAIQTLSELVKGIRALNEVPLGFILTMPVNPTETAIQEQADDVMHRMRERGTSLRLEDAYGSDFPAQLWTYLCDSYGDSEAKRAIDEHTLLALGQLCERKDLSNGPRTVIAAFKRVGQHYQRTKRPYTPIDLVDDYLHEHIVFEGRGSKITGTVRRLLELPAAQGSDQRQRAVKLLAAFPRGVNEEIAGELYSVIDELAEKSGWLGEYITQLSEGYALIGLQEQAEARPVLDEIIRDFRYKWHHVWDSLHKADSAKRGFLAGIVTLLFPPSKQGQAENFTYGRRIGDFESDELGVAFLIVVGSYDSLNTRFPERRVCVSVCTDKEALNRFQPPEEVDLDFRFFLEFWDMDRESADTIPMRVETANRDRRVDFHLNLGRSFGRHFPADLQFLRDIMAPEHTSAQVLLGLSVRMMEWLQDHSETNEADRQMIEAHRRQLYRFALQLLFPDASEVQAQGIKVSGAEGRLVQSAFGAKCAELYPNYKPLAITRNWRTTYLRNYRDALEERPLAERRGREPFVGSKEEIARTFHWTNTAFEANAPTLQQMGLLTFEWGPGRGAGSEASVTFREHPLEDLIRTTIQREGRERTVSVGTRQKRVRSLEVSRIKDVARREGYLPEEVDEAIELAILRHYVQREPDGTVREFAGALDAEELQHQAKELQSRLDKMAPHFPIELKDYQRLLEEAREYLNNPHDEVSVDAAYRKLEEARIRFEEFVKAKGRDILTQIAGLERETEQLQTDLQPRELGQPITGSAGFERHVDDQRKALQRRYQQLQRQVDALLTRLRQLNAQVERMDSNEDILCQILGEWKQVQRELQHLEQQQEDLRPYLAGVQHWREVVAKSTALRERLEPESPLWHRLDYEIAEAIMENFASRGMGGLLDSEGFKADIESLQTALDAEENRQRQQFLQRKEEYEDIFSDLLPQRMLQVTFDSKDVQQSYQVLYKAVMDKTNGWLSEKVDLARSLLSEVEYLHQERNIDTAAPRQTAEAAIEALRQARARLNYDLVQDTQIFRDYVHGLRTADEKLRQAHDTVSRLRTQKDEPTEEESLILQVQSSQRRSLEEIRRDCRERGENLSLDDLFERLKGLYRKGHIEIEVRRRE